jgi:hypothetical protein
MTPKVRKRSAAVVVHPRVDESLIPQTGANTHLDDAGAKPGAEGRQVQNPWPAEFGWDFPFDFPKPSR